jgi:hypothetical protein
MLAIAGICCDEASRSGRGVILVRSCSDFPSVLTPRSQPLRNRSRGHPGHNGSRHFRGLPARLPGRTPAPIFTTRSQRRLVPVEFASESLGWTPGPAEACLQDRRIEHGSAAALLVLLGLSAGLVGAAQLGDSGQLGRIMVAALVQVPAVWLIIGIVAAAYGLVPRLIVLGWVALAGFVLLGEFGSLFNLSHLVMDISPFAHVPRLPGGHLTMAPLLWLTATAAGLIAIGLAGFRRWDLD